jgi:purine-binding chemotaxis protein CheW
MTAAVSAAERPEQVLEFTLGADRYCVDIDHVEEIVAAGDLTPLPNTPPAVAGLMDLRGTSTTILDPTTVLDIGAPSAGTQVIILDGDQPVGWLVDRAHRVSTLDDVDVDTVPESPHVSGVISDGGRFVVWVEPGTVNGSVSI